MAGLSADGVGLARCFGGLFGAFLGLGDVVGRRPFARVGGVLRALRELALQRLDLLASRLHLRSERAQALDHGLLASDVDRLCLLRCHRTTGGGHPGSRDRGRSPSSGRTGDGGGHYGCAPCSHRQTASWRPDNRYRDTGWYRQSSPGSGGCEHTSPANRLRCAGRCVTAITGVPNHRTLSAPVARRPNRRPSQNPTAPRRAFRAVYCRGHGSCRGASASAHRSAGCAG